MGHSWTLISGKKFVDENTNTYNNCGEVYGTEKARPKNIFFWLTVLMISGNFRLSHGNEKFIRKWTKSVYVFSGFFNPMGTRMFQVRIAKSV